MGAERYDTDKYDTHYSERYEELFAPLKGGDTRLLELGILRGGSLLMWRDYFQNGTIAGLDINAIQIDDPTGRIVTYQGDQRDKELLSRITDEVAPGGFDIIIDDASHVGNYSRASFWHLFPNCLKPGGLYVIEDWGTGYWGHWHDGFSYKGGLVDPSFRPRVDSTYQRVVRSLLRGPLYGRHKYLVNPNIRSHLAGMVGFVKELVDEVAMEDITNPSRGIPPQRKSRIAKMQLSLGQVVVHKATE